MKKFYLFFISILLIQAISACSGHTLQAYVDRYYNDNYEHKGDVKSVNPSQNRALNSISPSQPKNDGYGLLQKKSDAFINEEWTPTLEKNSTIKKMNEEKGRDFRLQEYVDKARIYLEAQPDSNKRSHKEKMDSMPAIGKVD